MSRKTLLWTLGALIGIVVTAGITWGTSKLTSQHIGLSSQPLSAGRSLAPPSTTRTATSRQRTTSTTATITSTATRTHGEGASGGEPDD